MRIEVTQKHIDEGKRNRPTCCPVANALHEATKLRWYVTHRWAETEKCTKWFQLPDEVSQRIKLYDTEEKMEPFTFEWEGDVR
jgi:hypothetical protein